MNNKISIIVPVYNVEKYLSNCIDSIISQTYTNLEIILIDDGSTDNCPNICDEYALKDSRINVIHKQNGGQSSARNIALDICTGDYIGFVDSDDRIEPTMYEEMLNACLINDCDISICGFNVKKSVEIHYSFIMDNDCSISKELAQYNILTDIWGSQPCNKLYKSELWNEIRFPEGRIYEDLAILHKVFFLTSKNIAFVHKALYIYQLRDDSTSYSKSAKNGICLYLAFKDKVHFAESFCQEAREICIAKASSFALGVINLRIRNKILSTNENYIDAKNFLIYYKKQIVNNRFLFKKRKNLLKLYYFSNCMYFMLVKIFSMFR